MNRRHFVSSFAAAIPVIALKANPLAVSASVSAKGADPLTIVSVDVLELTGKNDYRAYYVKVGARNGLSGTYGPIDYEAAIQVDQFFASRLVGVNGLAIEAHWDKMIRASRHSRGSHYSIGLSAIDNALWELRGQFFHQPVYRLLGGERRRLRAYASCLGFSQEPGDLKAKVQALKAEGYRHQKWFLSQRGPTFGPEGVSKDAETFRLLREAAGDDTELMIDASRKWDLQYALAWCRKVERFHPWWIEEPFQSLHIDAVVELSRNTSIPVAMGEHFYSRWDAHDYLKAGAIRVVQADPEWCGGVSELVKICNIASVHGAHVIPHGHNLRSAMHVVASQPEELCPLVEFLIRKMTGNYHYFEKNPPLPVEAHFVMDELPGFGIELDESKIAEMKPVRWVKG